MYSSCNFNSYLCISQTGHDTKTPLPDSIRIVAVDVRIDGVKLAHSAQSDRIKPGDDVRVEVAV